MARMRVGNHVHVGNASAERPAKRAEKSEERNAASPIFAAGKKRRGHGGERAGNHRAILVPKIPANAPSDGKSQRDRDEIEEHAA